MRMIQMATNKRAFTKNLEVKKIPRVHCCTRGRLSPRVLNGHGLLIAVALPVPVPVALTLAEPALQRPAPMAAPAAAPCIAELTIPVDAPEAIEPGTKGAPEASCVH